MNEAEARRDKLLMLLRSLKLPGFASCFEEEAERAARDGLTCDRYLLRLAETEIEQRRVRKITRARKRSGLPAGKTLGNLELNLLPAKARRQMPALCEGGFLHRAENVLVFGLPGRGKSHLVCAVGSELIQRGFQVLFTPTGRLVQRLLAAKRDLLLERELRRLDAFDAVILDDIGYIQQDREEMEVLFAFFSERYERKSVMITSNLVFSQWDRIFKDPMTTAAAVDRLVHHSIILELNGDSYRTKEAEKRSGGRRKPPRKEERKEE